MWFKWEVNGDDGGGGEVLSRSSCLFWFFFSFQYRVSCLLTLPQRQLFPISSLFSFTFLLGMQTLTVSPHLSFALSLFLFLSFHPSVMFTIRAGYHSPFFLVPIRLSTSTCTIVLYSSPLLYMYLLILYWCSLISVPLYIVHYIGLITTHLLFVDPSPHNL